jgi:hypothetical protein
MGTQTTSGARVAIRRTVLARFESQIRGGTGFLYEVSSGRMKLTDRLGYEVARILREPQTAREIKDKLGQKGIIVHAQVIQRFITKLVAEGFADRASKGHRSAMSPDEPL